MNKEISKEKKREHDFAEWLDKFKSYYFNTKDKIIEFSPNSSKELNKRYWEIITEVREFMDDPENSIVSHSKMMAVVELTIMSVLPIQHENKEVKEFLNGHLAIFIAKHIVRTFRKIKSVFHIQPFENEHLKLLLNTNYSNNDNFFLFHCSETWYFYSILAKNIDKKIIHKLLAPGEIIIKNIID